MSENFLIFFVLFWVLPRPSPPETLRKACVYYSLFMCVWHEVVAVNVTADGVRIQGKPRGKIACFSLETALRGRPRNGIYVSVISKNFFTLPFSPDPTHDVKRRPSPSPGCTFLARPPAAGIDGHHVSETNSFRGA
jgi:hypothetical protein